MTNSKRLIGIVLFGMGINFILFRLFIRLQGIDVSYVQTIGLGLVNLAILGVVLFGIFKMHSVDVKRVDKLSSKYELTMILYDLLKKLANEEDTHSVYESILIAAAKAIPSCEYGSIILLHNEKMVFEASFGFNQDYLGLIEFDIAETALYKLTQGKMDRAILIPDILTINHEESSKEFVEILKQIGVENIRSTIAAPIYVGDVNIGSINLDSNVPNCFTEEDIETLELFGLEVSKFVQLHRISEVNRKMSRYDDLTQIFNRGYCKKEIKKLISEQVSFVLVSLDLNRLKYINDEYGHDVGDIYLLTFVKMSKIFIQENVIFSRYGGDEFILIFPEADQLSVKVVMDDICNYMNTHSIDILAQKIYVSFSYGMALYPEDTTTYDELLKLADARMYIAKNEYKNNLNKAYI